MQEEINKLKKEFIRIKDMGYIKATRGGTTGIGKTFEDLIDKEEDTTPNPDFNGIEIKTKRVYSYSYTTLFNATPNGKEVYEIKRLVNKYGYPDKILKNNKVLNVDVNANRSTLVANKFLFKLIVNRKEKKVFLEIYDKNLNFLEKETFWSFQNLEQRLNQKLKYLAFIKAWLNKINNEQYYKYTSIVFYELKSFEKFLSLIESGIIRVTFTISVFRQGERIAEIHDRGTSFSIQETNLEKLFNKLDI